MGDENYSEKIAFWSRSELKKALEKYAKEEGVKLGVICRRALFDFLKGKRKLQEGKEYL